MRPTTTAALAQAAPWIFVALWSTGYVGARFGLPYADPVTFTALRFAIVVLLLGTLALLRGQPLPRSPRMWMHLAVSGVLIHAAFIGGVFTAIDLGIDIGIASLIAGAQPLLTALIVVPLLGERLSVRQWAGFAIGFAGLALVVTRSFALGALSWPALGACVVALGGISFGTVYQKRFVVGIDLMTGSVIQFAAAAVVCTVWAGHFEAGEFDWNRTLILTLVWLCVVLSVGAVSILLYLVRAGAASRVASLFYLVPPATAVQGYWFFGEALTLVQLVGMGVTALGVAMINAAPRAHAAGDSAGRL